jgi:hypothetical protein
MKRVQTHVAIDEAILRALTFLVSYPPGNLAKASQLAYAIWPDITFRSQGAGGAASRVLRAAEKRGLCTWTTRWNSPRSDSGWAILSAGRVWLAKHKMDGSQNENPARANLASKR